MDDDGNVNYEWTGGNNDEEPNVDTQNGFIKTPMQACSIVTNGTTHEFVSKYNRQNYQNNSSK
jgi:hypothetical protein